MAEKAEKKPESASGGAEKKDAGGAGHGAPSKPAKGGIGGMFAKTPVLLGGVMLIEAAVLFVGFKFLGSGPRSAAAEVVAEATGEGAENAAETGDHGSAAATDDHGSGGDAAPGAKGGATVAGKRQPTEVQVINFRAPNKLSGRTFLYDVDIYAVTRGENAKKVKATIDARKALISDRIRTIIAQTDPEKLGGGSEPGLETLRRQVKYQLDQIVGEGLIDEVLVPRCIPFRTDY
jgi:hypothetical protein